MANRLRIYSGLLAAFGGIVVTGAAHAQAGYPDRPIRIIVPLAPGGGSDYTARYIGLRLADRVHQSVVVDNRPAASGIVGTEMVAKAVPTGTRCCSRIPRMRKAPNCLRRCRTIRSRISRP